MTTKGIKKKHWTSKGKMEGRHPARRWQKLDTNCTADMEIYGRLLCLGVVSDGLRKRNKERKNLKI